MPTVSIIMSSYNGALHIRESIESILRQTYKDWEFIICDDCSTDNTAEIIKEYESKDSRIRYLKNESNSKLAYSLNKCIKCSSGEYIARMDDDDIAEPNRLMMQVDFLNKNPDVAVVGSNVELFNSTGVLGVRTYPEYADLEHSPRKVIQFAHPAVVIRRNVIEDLGGYTVSKLTNRGQDFDLWARLFAKGYKGYNIQRVLLHYRESETGYKKTKFSDSFYSFLRHVKCYKLLKFPFYMYIRAFDPIITYLVPRKIMAKWHSWRLKNE